MDNKKKILILDDSSSNVILLDNLITVNGYASKVTQNVKDALTYLERETPDLILLDLLMPFVDGYEFLNIIKNDSKMVNIPVLVISAVSDPQEIQKAEEYGIVEFISKPLNLKYLEKKIMEVLGGK